MATALQIVPELTVVVDLAVLDDLHGPVLARNGLVARFEVDDRQSPRRERDGPVHVFAEAVGAAMDEGGAHRGERRRVAARDSTDPAHGVVL